MRRGLGTGGTTFGRKKTGRKVKGKERRGRGGTFSIYTFLYVSFLLVSSSESCDALDYVMCLYFALQLRFIAYDDEQKRWQFPD